MSAREPVPPEALVEVALTAVNPANHDPRADRIRQVLLERLNDWQRRVMFAALEGPDASESEARSLLLHYVEMDPGLAEALESELLFAAAAQATGGPTDEGPESEGDSRWPGDDDAPHAEASSDHPADSADPADRDQPRESSESGGFRYRGPGAEDVEPTTLSKWLNVRQERLPIPSADRPESTPTSPPPPPAPFAPSPQQPDTPTASSASWWRVPVRRERARRPSQPSHPRRVVSTGVAARGSRTALRPRTALAVNTDYVYWLSVGDHRVPGRVDLGPGQQLPPFSAPAGTVLRVVVFPFAGGLRLESSAPVGELVVGSDGRLSVGRQPSREHGGDRLEFPFRTPSQPGMYGLRCSIYLGARLLQSRRLEAQVASSQRWTLRRSLTSVTDYTVLESLDPEVLATLRPPRVSILVNDGPAGTHDFRFVGDAPDNSAIGTATLDAATLGLLLENARKALRLTAWGTESDWQPEDVDRYEAGRPQTEVASDLIAMARRGYRIWYAVAAALAAAIPGQPAETGGTELRDRFSTLLRSSGAVELASRQSLRLAIPTALIYDYPLDSTNKSLLFCQDAAAAIAEAGDLTLAPCFDGRCPNYDGLDVVCPGGFWGYRHELGVPMSLGSSAGAQAMSARIAGGDAPVMFVGTTTDPAFTRRLRHLEMVHNLHVPMSWQLEDDRDALLKAMAGAAPHVVYLLCHGVENDDGVAGLVVGNAQPPVAITPDNLGAYHVSWSATRPLVLLNGCRTSALNPAKPLNFVEAFLTDAHASGVIGTEISIFEPLACDFAEAVLARFVRDDMTLGRAVRESRLSLLQQGNPLGLAYVPYAPTELQMCSSA